NMVISETSELHQCDLRLRPARNPMFCGLRLKPTGPLPIQPRRSHVLGGPRMRRLSLSTKLFVAALPLLIAVAILLTISVTNDFAKVREAERGAQLGSLWDPLL